MVIPARFRPSAEEAGKQIQPETEMPGADPEYMTLEDDGQDSFDEMWLNGDTVTEDGYR